jgi:bifunctional DNA-binding transcriptional regulator/antitoxin component of YhaV-PrlF toxin-antitoxin module
MLPGRRRAFMAVIYKDPGPVSFVARLERMSNGGSFVLFPYDVEELFGVKGRVPVKVTYDGIPYRGSMVRMRSAGHLLLILKEIRQALGKAKGDKIRVTVELDEGPRVIVLAPDVEKAYKKKGVLEVYRALAYTHQREYALWIDDAKQAMTRRKRIDKSIADMKAAKVKRKG